MHTLVLFVASRAYLDTLPQWVDTLCPFLLTHRLGFTKELRDLISSLHERGRVSVVLSTLIDHACLQEWERELSPTSYSACIRGTIRGKSYFSCSTCRSKENRCLTFRVQFCSSRIHALCLRFGYVRLCFIHVELREKPLEHNAIATIILDAAALDNAIFQATTKARPVPRALYFRWRLEKPHAYSE